MKLICYILMLVLMGCTSDHEKTTLISYEISGRDQDHTPIYRVKAPSDWLIKEPTKNESLVDTKKPLCEFLIDEDETKVRITIHNFPSKSLEERIPPNAQIVRWKKQFDDLDPESVHVVPQSFAGFLGMLLDASGEIEAKEMNMLAWSMQIAPRHYRRLTDSKSVHNIKAEQMRACYTIKVLGPNSLVEKNRKAILNFARSFELIEEVP